MSHEKTTNKTEDKSNYIKSDKKNEKEDNKSDLSQEKNFLLRPIAIKQTNIANTPTNSNMNNYKTISVIYPNQPAQHLNNINQINIKTKDSCSVQNINNNDKGAFSFIGNAMNNKNSNNKINNLKNESGELGGGRIHCTCKKTKCIKKYCECFSSGVFCFNCKCDNCENVGFFVDDNNNNNVINNHIITDNNNINDNEINENKNNKQNNESNYDNKETNSKKLIICTCSKSGCNKNYCECFKAKVKCNNKCRCIKCLNKPDDIIPLDEEKIIKKTSSTILNDNNSLLNMNNANNFTVHKITVNINKAQTFIHTDKLDYFETNKFLSKKRNDN